PYQMDPDDPRAPTREQWSAMSDAERERVVQMLPSELPHRTLPEGDRHRIPKQKAAEALSEFFRRMGRRVYLSAELPVYYPDESWFAPDLIAVLDVEPGYRDKWVVSAEGKGLDFVLEITLSGDRRKDLEDNVARYAKLGIPEYFILDLRAERIVGYRLDETRPNTYVRIVPQAGSWSSRVLGLDLVLEGGRIRFYAGSAPLLEADELIARLSSMVDELVRKREENERLLEEERRRRAAAEQHAERLAQRLRELGVDPDAE
ncbi:MAG: Uma2 family endonuclease, partial [Myxococcota bacterium]